MTLVKIGEKEGTGPWQLALAYNAPVGLSKWGNERETREE